MPENSVRHHVTAAARDIAVLGSVMGAFAAIMIAFTRPYWEPFAQLPADVARIQEQIVGIQARLSDGLSPKIVSFHSALPVIEKVKQGETLPILFFLRRNASCQTEVQPSFYNIDRNYRTSGEPYLAQRAPVTEQSILFQVRVPIPEDLPPARYVYTAELVPIDCGVYGPMQAMPSQPFDVVAK